MKNPIFQRVTPCCMVEIYNILVCVSQKQQCHFPEPSVLHNYHHENLKFLLVILCSWLFEIHLFWSLSYCRSTASSKASSSQSDLVLSLSISSALSFLYGNPVAASFFFLVLLSLLSFPTIVSSVMCFGRQFLYSLSLLYCV